MKLATIAAFLTICATGSVCAETQIEMLTEPGRPAADFPSNYIYWSVEQPAIGRGGYMAFTGAADTSLNSTSNNTNAVWAGVPGNLHAVIKENESPAGFPPSVVFDLAYPGSLEISKSGNLVFEAHVVGSSTGHAFIAEINGSTLGILKDGDQAPGFEAGVQVLYVSGVSISDAGMLVGAHLTNGDVALWFWDVQTQSFELITTTGQDISPVYPGCGFVNPAVYNRNLNNQGEVTISSSLYQVSGTTTCPKQAIMKWKQGSFSKVVASGDTAPGLPNGTVFYSKFVGLWARGSTIPVTLRFRQGFAMN